MNSSFLKSDSFIYIKLYHFFLCFSMTKLVFTRTNIANIASYFLVIFIFYFIYMYILFLLIFMIKYIIMPKQKSMKQQSVFSILVYNFMLGGKISNFDVYRLFRAKHSHNPIITLYYYLCWQFKYCHFYHFTNL